MTDPMKDPAGTPGAVPPDATAPEATGPQPGAAAPASPSFEQRMEGFGKEVDAAANRFGQRVDETANRFAKDPGVVRAAGTLRIAWGLVVLAFGLWFTADVTLGLDLPSIPWDDAGPIILPAAVLLLGLVILLQAATRQRT